MLARLTLSIQQTCQIFICLVVVVSCPIANADDFTVSDDQSLRQTIESINNSNASSHNINFASGSSIALSDNLPILFADGKVININGSGSTINGGEHRVFFVDDGDVRISDLTIKGALSQGGSGGVGRNGGGGGAGAGSALFVNENANVTISRVTFEDNRAIGGNGGDTAGSSSLGMTIFNGGGGGYSGDGGASANGFGIGGGGGGGFNGDGGDGSNGGGGGLNGNGGEVLFSRAGGGGGGISGDGGDAFNSGGGGGGEIGNGGSFTPFGSSLSNSNGSGDGGGLGGNNGDTDGGVGGSEGGGDGGRFGETGSGNSGGGGGGGSNGGDGAAGDNMTGGGNGGDGGFGGGGGGGGNGGVADASGNGGDGGFGGGGGGSGNYSSARSAGALGGDGGEFGGGGGGGNAGGEGGDFGGGGGGSDNGFYDDTDLVGGGDGGFLGGGGGGSGSSGGSSSSEFGGGKGGSGFQERFAFNPTVNFQGGDGGGAYGGAIFVRSGGTLTIIDSGISGGSVTGGSGGQPNSLNVDDLAGADGSAAGSGIFLHGSGTTLNWTVTSDSEQVVSDDIAGLATLVKQGNGKLTLSGTNSYGDTNIQAGRLVIAGSQFGNVSIQSGAFLGGDGVIHGNLENFGALADSNSIASLTVNGNYRAADASKTIVEIRPATNPNAGIDGDQLVVNGNVTIDSAATIEVTSFASADQNAFQDGATYTFLNAQEITGTYDSISSDLAFFDAELNPVERGIGGSGLDAFYSFSLSARPTEFASLAMSANGRSLGSALDLLEPTASGDLEQVIGTARGFTNSQVQSFLQSTSASGFATHSQIMIQGNSLFNYTLSNQIRSIAFDSTANSTCFRRCACTCVPQNQSKLSQWDGWLLGYGIGGAAEFDGNASGIHHGVGGATVGIQRRIASRTLLGFFGGYAGSNTTGQESDFSIQANGGQVGSYLLGNNGKLYYIASGGFQFDGLQSTRNINVGSIDRSATAQYSGWQGFSYLERGLTLRPARNAVLQPYLGLQYSYFGQDAFTESGAGALNLAVAELDAHSLRGVLGGRLRGSLGHCGWRRHVTPEFRLALMHEFLKTGANVNSQFAGVENSGFSSSSLDLNRSWGLAGAGLRVRLSEKMNIALDYNIQTSNQEKLHIGSASVSILR